MQQNAVQTLSLPLLPLRDVVVYPQMVIPLFVGREKSIQALDAAMAADKRVLLVAQREAGQDDPGTDDHPMFNILRAQRNVGDGGSRLGVVLTDRRQDDLTNTVAGVDGRLVFGGDYSLRFQAAGSWTDLGGTDMAAPLWEAGLTKTGRHFGFRSNARGIHQDFRTFSGFISRPGIAQLFFAPRYTFYPGGLVESFTSELRIDGTWQYEDLVNGDTVQDNKYHFNFNATLRGGCPVTAHLLWEQLQRARRLSLADVLRARASAGPDSARPKSVIMIWLRGGPSHIDSYDMKPDAPTEIRGEFRPIATNVPGIQICEYLPRHAEIMDKLAIVRGIRSNDLGDHTPHYILTGFPDRGKRPAFGSIVSALQPRDDGMPAFVATYDSDYQRALYAGPAHEPFYPRGEGIENLRLAREITLDRLQERRPQRAHGIVRGEEQKTVQGQQHHRPAFARANVGREAEEAIQRRLRALGSG